jgi:flagellar hook protein FlgE
MRVTGWLTAVVLLAGCGAEGPFLQGVLRQTGSPYDLALSGPGFLELAVGWWGTEYTRDGQLQVAADGYLVSLDGLRLRAYPSAEDGGLGLPPGPLQIGGARSPLRATQVVTIRGNLAADALLSPTPAFDVLNPLRTSNFRTSVVVYDSIGQSHTLEVYYRKTAEGAWDFHATTEGGGLTGGTLEVASEVAAGSLNFDVDGHLTDVTQVAAFNPIGATNPQPLTFNFGAPINAGGTGRGGFTQYGRGWPRGGGGGLPGGTELSAIGRVPARMVTRPDPRRVRALDTFVTRSLHGPRNAAPRAASCSSTWKPLRPVPWSRPAGGSSPASSSAWPSSQPSATSRPGWAWRPL